METLPGGSGATKQASVVADAFAYIDTVELFFRKYRPKGLLPAIHAQGCKAWFKSCEDARGSVWGYRLLVQRPNLRVMRLLDQHQREHNGKLSRFDVAVDLMAQTHQRETLRQWLEGHAVLRWCRPDSMMTVGETLYWSPYWLKRSTRTLVLYADRPSKITGRPCVHFELRYYGTNATRKTGYEYASELIDLDPKALFGSHVKLIDVEPIRVRLVREAVRADRKKVRSTFGSKRLNGIADRYRTIIPHRVRSLLRHAQRIKDLYPGRVARLQSIPIDVLRVPISLTWEHENIYTSSPHTKFPSAIKGASTRNQALRRRKRTS